MYKFLYIGQNTAGTTSSMRYSYLQKILHDWNCSVIDTDKIFHHQPRLFKSIAFRFNRGPVISAINRNIVDYVADKQYDLVWVDKGVFIKKSTLLFLKQRTNKLIHYTPDTAFIFHKSHLFNEGSRYYDFLVTTKSYELANYYQYVSKEKVILTTQGFDKSVHKSYHEFTQKVGAILIGLYEPERGKVVQLLLDNGIQVKIAGAGWEGFVRRNSSNTYLEYLGKGLYGEDYAKAISSSLFGLGLLSKKFPELHTTRTFEIPACKTALVTEINREVQIFFKEDEAVFFNDYQDMVSKIKHFDQHRDKLASITENGYQNVLGRGFDYKSILQSVISKIIS